MVVLPSPPRYFHKLSLSFADKQLEESFLQSLSTQVTGCPCISFPPSLPIPHHCSSPDLLV